MSDWRKEAKEEIVKSGVPKSQATYMMNKFLRTGDDPVYDLDKFHNKVICTKEAKVKTAFKQSYVAFNNFLTYKRWLTEAVSEEIDMPFDPPADEPTKPWEDLNPPPTINNEPTRYYVRVKFSASMWPYPVKKDVMYRTYKDIIDGPLPQYGEMLYIRDCHGQSWTWNKKIIDEIKVYPQLEKVKEEEEDDEPEEEDKG